MNEEQFILLAIKVLSGNHLPEEPEELRKQIADHEPYRVIFERLSVYWKADTHLKINEEAALDKVWDRIGQLPDAVKAGKPEGFVAHSPDALVVAAPGEQIFHSPEPADDIPVRKIGWRRWLAAAVLIPLVAISIWYLVHPSPKMELVEKYNQKGIRSIIILPDGSKIWLNADSRLKYPAAFQASLREVYLEGEAFFEIAKNPQRPFIVHLPKGKVNVLGTSFDIRAYEDEEWMTTSVATGLVAFVPTAAHSTSGSSTAGQPTIDPSTTHPSTAAPSTAGPSTGPSADSFYLTPNRKAVYDFQTGAVQVKPTDAEADRGWINGIMTFNNESLGRIATELERSFGKPIKFSSASIAQYRYTATFKNNTEEEILSTLRKVKAFHFIVTDKFIEINK
ncbi:MAG TPA: FecR domain-containing protein [Puia sp.]|nr:FecR domain-containing protein [Puia sp.]